MQNSLQFQAYTSSDTLQLLTKPASIENLLNKLTIQSNKIEHRIFNVTPEFIERLAGPSANRTSASSGFDSNTLHKIFTDRGVAAPKGSSYRFFKATSTLSVHQNVNGLAQVDFIIRETLDDSPRVNHACKLRILKTPITTNSKSHYYRVSPPNAEAVASTYGKSIYEFKSTDASGALTNLKIYFSSRWLAIRPLDFQTLEFEYLDRKFRYSKLSGFPHQQVINLPLFEENGFLHSLEITNLSEPINQSQLHSF